MKRKFLVFSTLSVIFLISVVGSVWAASSPNANSRNPWAQATGKLKNLQATEEAIIKVTSPSGLKKIYATPPGILRKRVATQTSELARLKNHVYIGTISAVLPSNKAFTLTTKDGPKTVQTNDQTKFVKGGLQGAKASFANLRVGDSVVAVGRTDENGLLTAKIVVVTAAKEKPLKRQAVYGVVVQKTASDSATLLTLRHPKNDKSFQVLVNSSTKITGKGLVSATVNDIQIGSRIVAVGELDSAGLITAKRLHIIPGLARGLFGTQPSTPSGRRVTPTPTVIPIVTPTVTPTVP